MCSQRTVPQARGTVVRAESADNIVLAEPSEGSEWSRVTVEIKMYSKDYAAPRWVLSDSEIDILKMKLSKLPESSRIDVPDWGYISVTNYNDSGAFPYSKVYIVNNRVILVDFKGERSYYVDIKKAGEWLMLLAGTNVPSSMYSRPVRSGSGVAMVVSSGDGGESGGQTEVRNRNMMEYAPYIVVVLMLILFAYMAMKRPKTEGA